MQKKKYTKEKKNGFFPPKGLGKVQFCNYSLLLHFDFPFTKKKKYQRKKYTKEKKTNFFHRRKTGKSSFAIILFFCILISLLQRKKMQKKEYTKEKKMNKEIHFFSPKKKKTLIFF
jgi:hypothetical protein